MDRRRLSRVIILLFFAMAAIACSLGSKTEAPGAAPASKTGADAGLLGESITSTAGGFKLNPVKGYDTKETFGIISMLAPGADDKTGPGIIAIGGLNDVEYTPRQLLEKFKEGSSEFQFTNEKEIKVAGQEGLVFDASGTESGKAVKGRLVLVTPGAKQQFVLVGFAPEDRWKEVSPKLEAVLASVTFFQAIIPTVENETNDLPGIPTLPPLPEQPAGDDPPASPPAGQTGIRQWAITARASSQYGSSDWAAKQATGEPDVMYCADDVRAWASSNKYGKDWIELVYAVPVLPTEINIYQSYNPSQVVEVQMTDINGKTYSAWTGEPEKVDNCPDLMTITLGITKKVLVNKVRIIVDQSVMQLGWDEIDAVELVGYPQSQ